MLRSLSRSRATRDVAASSTLAIAVSLLAGAMPAQAALMPTGSFDAASTVVGGSASVATGTNSTTVTVNSQTAVINWSPNDTAIGGGPINFQLPGTTATFVNNPGSTADFAVLNNILPTDPSRMVQFNGTVISQLQTLAGASSIGGTVYFYSPGGILVSPSAVINVGNLGLSASPVAYNATTGAFGATGSVVRNGAQTVTFGQANAGSSVQILSGAQINANSSDGSYVAVVAPRINNTGTINVNGNAALVAADAATITFNPSGLYSISLDVGTSATGTALFNGGTITGSASTGVAAHQIYLMTAPKNTLINMLIGQGSNIGFDVAGAANVNGNAIILSGGYDVLGGTVNSSLAPKGGIGGSVNTNVTASNVTSALTVISSNNAQVDGSNGGTTTLASDVTVLGYKTAFLGAFASSTLAANGRVTVQAIDPGFSAAPGTSQVTGGTAQIFAQGGTVALHGAINIVSAQATGATSQISGVAAGNGTGGNAQVSASSGGSITVDGSLFVSANGQGGFSRTNGVGGGNGKGGNALVQANGANSSVILKSNVGVGAQGQGGTGLCLAVCTAEAGTGTGGTAQVNVSAGGSITAQDPNGTNFFDANADGFGGGAVNTNAGNGVGGNVFVTVQSGSTLNLVSKFSGSALGAGGVEDGTNLTGGAGTGGNVQLNVNVGGTLTASGAVSLVAQGAGGAGDPDSAGTGSSGGGARGGFAGIFSNGGNATFTGPVQISADGNGGFAGNPGTTGKGGAGTGGTALVNAAISGTTVGTIALRGPTDLTATGRGGSGFPGGIGTGGNASVNASGGSNVAVDSDFFATANGQGGSSKAAGTIGGNGKGGTTNAQANGANSTITFKSNVGFTADGYGGTGNCVTTCTAEAGTGSGGSAGVFLQSGGSLTTLDPNATNVFHVSASGYGGGAFHNNAGDGTGGSASVTVQTGSALTFGSAVNVFTEGRGGSQAGTLLVGGAGTGGSANINLQGGTLTANRTFSLSSQGYGGVADADTSGSGSSGGAGFGGGACDATGTTCIAGGAFITSNGGNGTFNMGVNVDASGFGGSSFAPGTTGAGGAGTGGFSQIRIGSNSLNTNNATLTFNGPDSFVSAVGMGGRGYPGGVGMGGSAIVQTYYGTIQGTGLIVDSSGTGGNGSLNGKGGDGFGGFSSIQARNNPFGTATITLNSASLFGIGTGGRGGDSINVSLAGGAGGVGSGGSTGATAQAGDGKLTITGALSSFAGAFGGAGGNGANDAVLAGGNGGAGGAAIGTGPNSNGSQNGTVSGQLGTTNAGSARFGSVAISVAAQGGAGGTGGNVSITGGPQGNGGAGGDATGGFGGLLVRGSTVTVTGNTQLSGDAFGGNGGQGAVVGNGGNALVGGSGGTGGGLIFVTATNRFQVPTQRGTLIAGTITGSVAVVGGTGGTAGTSTVGDSPINFTVINSDVTASSLGLFASAASVAPNALPSVVQLSGGTINVGTAFQFNSAGPITVGLDTATLNAGFVGLSGSDWILPATPPLLAGTINANTGASFSSGNNIVTYANVNFNYPVSFNAIGNFQLGNVTAQGDFVSFSGGTSSFGTINATNVDIAAGNAITVGQITTPGYVSLDNTFGRGNAAGIGNIVVEGIVAGRDVGILSNGSILAPGLIQAGANVNIKALGSVTIGNVSAGLVNPSTITGDTFEIAIRSGGALVTGNLTSQTDIGLLAPVSIRTGTLTGRDAQLLSSGAISTGAINATARVLIADASMAALGMRANGYDPNPAFAASPVRSSGAIAIGGTVQAGQFFTAATQQGFTSGAISTASGPILIDSGAAILVGNLASGGNAVLHATGTITTGAINSGDLLVLGGDTMTTGAINARNRVLFADQSAYNLGTTGTSFNFNSVFAGVPFTNLAPYRSAGAVTVNGDINASQINVTTARNLSTGVITVPNGLATSIGGSATTGALHVGNGFTFAADSNITTGAVDVGTIATAVTNPSYYAAYFAGGNLVTGNIQTRNGILMSVGGNATTGILTTGEILGLVHGASSYGPITATGRVLLADRSMAALGVTTTAPFFYDVNLVFNAATISSSGPITINGAVSAASLTTDSLGAFTSGAITTARFVDVTTGANALVSGAIQGGEDVSINAQGGITVGNIKAGASTGTREPIPFSIGLIANGGSVVAGNLSGSQAIGIGSSGSITTGTLSGANLLVGGGSTITTGAISMSGRALLASYAMIPLGGMPGSNTPYDATLVFAATPIAAPGAITINGIVNTGQFLHAATLQGFTSGAITTGTDLSLAVGGAAQVGALGAGGPITINADRLVLGGSISTPGNLTIATVQSLTAPNLTIGGDIAVTSQNALTTGNVTSSNGAVSLKAGSTLTTGSVNAATTLSLIAPGTITAGVLGGNSLNANGAINVSGGDINIMLGNPVFSRDSTTITATGSLTSDSIFAQNAETITVAGNASVSGLATNAGALTVNVGGSLSTGGINAKSVAISAGTYTAANIDSQTNVAITTTGAMRFSNVTTPNGTITLNSGSTITGGRIRASADILSRSVGSTTLQELTGSTGAITATGTDITVTTPISSALNTSITGTGALSLNTVTSTNGAVSLTAGTTLTSGAVNARTAATLSSIGAMQVASISAGNQVTISADSFVLGSPTTPGTIVTTGGGLSISTAKALVLPSLKIGGNIALDSRTALTTGDITSGTGSVVLSTVGLLTTGAIKAATTLSLTTQGSIVAGVLGGSTLDAVGAITVSGGDILIQQGNQVFSSQSSVTINATGSLTSGTISAQTTNSITTTGNVNAGSINAGNGAVTLQSGGSVQMAQGNANGFTVNAGTTFASGNIGSSASISVTTGGNLSTANLAANGGSATVRSGGTLNAGVINTTNGILVNSTGAASVQGLTSSGAIQFNSSSTFSSTGNIASANQVIGGAAGNMTLANVTASGGVVELASSQGNLTTGRISAGTDVATIAGGSLSVGQVSGRDIVLLGGSNVQVGNISAGAVTNAATGQITGATGRVLIANSSIGSAGGTFGNFNFNAVFNSTGGAVITNNPPRIGGTVNITGTVNANVFGSYSQGAMTGQLINAFGSLEVESGGLVTVGQRWTSPDLSILSNDIAIQPSQVLQTITTTAGLSSGTTGTVTLASLNANGAFVGDGLTAGQGYALSNAEVGLVQSGSLTIGAAVASGLATTMTIGNLSLTGPQAGSNVDNQRSGAVQFVTGNPQTLVPSGTIRVTGAVTAKGFLAANQLQFQAGTFELDTAGGSLTVTDSSNALAGGIAISADHIHIAAASILDKLRVDPLYATRIADLNTPPTQPLANPVLSAAQLIFAPTQTLYIQNTGTAAVPAGFFVPLAGLTIKPPSSRDTQPGQIAAAVSLVINGQFVGTSSTTGTGQSTGAPAPITGATAFQQFVQTKPTGLTADSQFNGCVIAAGSCSMMSTPTPDLSTQIQVLQTPTLPTAPAIVAAVQQASAEVTADPQQQEQTADKPTEAEQQEEEKAQASAKAPIAPPAPMIDTRPLSPPVSVDEPVAGGGNPALFGIGAAANQTEGGDK